MGGAAGEAWEDSSVVRQVRVLRRVKACTYIPCESSALLYMGTCIRAIVSPSKAVLLHALLQALLQARQHKERTPRTFRHSDVSPCIYSFKHN